MNQKDLQDQNYLDILFSGKNKSYGAYQLRKDFNRRMGISILTGIALIMIFLTVTAMAHREDEKLSRPVIPDSKIVEMKTNKRSTPPPPKPENIARREVTTKKFVPPTIKKDDEIEKTEVPEQDELKNAIISSKNVVGKANTDVLLKDVQFGKANDHEKKIELPEKEDINKIHIIVEQEPIYPGGEDKISADVSKNFEYPKLAIENGIEGTVIVRFVVEKDGSISHLELIRGLGYGIDEAALKAVKKLKKFAPAQQNGKAVRYYYSIPVICQLQ